MAAELSEIEGNRMSIITPYGPAHIPTSLIDSHPELVRSMVLASIAEWMRG